MGLEIARNGFYIPIFNLDGDVLFSPEDFDYLRNCMQGFETHPFCKIPLKADL